MMRELIIVACQEFENALKDVVSTKRVSASKMQKLSEVAKKCFEVRSDLYFPARLCSHLPRHRQNCVLNFFSLPLSE